MKLTQIYRQIKEENEKLGKVLVPRRSPEERAKNYLIAVNKKIQEYIKNGSKGDLDLRETPITSLPDNLTKVGGVLALEYSLITSLPDNLTIEGSLWADNTPLAILPNNLTIGEDLALRRTQIASLPEYLKVGGWVWLYGTPLSKQYAKEQIRQMAPGIKGGISKL